LNLNNLYSIPHDKISYSSYNSAFTAGVFIIHRDLIDYVHKIYYDKLEECISIDENNNSFASEQHIMTLIKDDHPELFHEIGNDYGSILEIIYSNHV
jgi:hypothetical protein